MAGSSLRDAFHDILSQGEFCYSGDAVVQEGDPPSRRGPLAGGTDRSLASSGNVSSLRPLPLFAEGEGDELDSEESAASIAARRRRARENARASRAADCPAAGGRSGEGTPQLRGDRTASPRPKKRDRWAGCSLSFAGDDRASRETRNNGAQAVECRTVVSDEERDGDAGFKGAKGLLNPSSFSQGAAVSEPESPPREGRRHAKERRRGSDEEGESGDFEETEDVLRILIATDTHLGYKAEDSERGGDSFETFEEILELGRKLNVDFLLHGGDLFDDNRPSRTTMYRTFCLLRRFCLGGGAVRFEVLPGACEASSQASKTKTCRDEGSEKGRDAAGHAPPAAVDSFRFGLNFLNENINICMPIFAMHGNHDDPGEQSHLSPLDLLEAAQLINYFGRTETSDEVIVKPILIRKGLTKVAIYGVGWIRDARLHRAFSNEKVRFLVPTSTDGDASASDWFNIMVVHQNMYKGAFGGQPAKNCVHEQMLPSFLDLAIWGHEHDCHVDLRESPQGTFSILQPGSSIATSLVAGEALPKHAFLLEIRGDTYRITPHRLRSVRPFIFEDIVLSDLLQPKEPSLAASSGLSTSRSQAQKVRSDQPFEDRDVWQFLTDTVEELLARHARATPRVEAERGDAAEAAAAGRRGESLAVSEDAFELFCNYSTGKKRKLPLVRLRVEHSGFSTISTARFGAQFVGRVANPGDILHFYRKRKAARQTAGDKAKQQLPDLEIEEVAGAHETSEIRDIIFHFLEETNTLDLLPEPDFNVAVQDFVVKMDANAITAFVDRSLKAARREAKSKLLELAPDLSQDVEPADVQAVISERTKGIREKRLRQGFPDEDDSLMGEKKEFQEAEHTVQRGRSRPRDETAAAHAEEDDFVLETLDMSHLPERKTQSRKDSAHLLDEAEWSLGASESASSEGDAGAAARSAAAASRGARGRKRGTASGRLGGAKMNRSGDAVLEAAAPEERGKRGGKAARGRGASRATENAPAEKDGDRRLEGLLGAAAFGGHEVAIDLDDAEDADCRDDGAQALAGAVQPAGEASASRVGETKKSLPGGSLGSSRRQTTDLRSFFGVSQRGSAAGCRGASQSQIPSLLPSKRTLSRPCGASDARGSGAGASEERDAERDRKTLKGLGREGAKPTALGASLAPPEFTRKQRGSYTSQEDARRNEDEPTGDEEEDDMFLSSLGRAAVRSPNAASAYCRD
ncbi:Mre11 DNA-binding domain-containing protein [Besnoitia besnoiti]|uniref:Mre11 DNA-binding domain-containing protein n=1 Tax=Besnoitia besnoiti TaxID=94643 RepID=A0A2A9M6V4_BESBE|nr:Mre11 DNA-binding domain-containing protein [Besnoitia besnoiti]PFH31363.1 Mre11 DNA-binding domain-containing protein [Besnoitia besnoiti]